VGGATVRVRFSNTFGDQPLEIGRAAIGVELSGASVAAGTNRPLLFAGQTAVTIPPGAEVLSDPVNLTVAPLQDLVVSTYLPQASGPATQHADAQQVNYVASGDQALSDSGAAFTTQTQSWYLLDDVDVLVPKRVRGTVVALGDSITDGAASTVNTNARWPNDLARRLDAREGSTLSVIDEGISGNRVLNNSPCFGVDALARLDRDVLSQAGVRDVILLEGTNDIGFSQTSPTNVYPGVPVPCFLPNTDVSAAQIIAGYQQIIAQVHAKGLRIFGGTLTPFKGAGYFTTAGEAKREAVNAWVRSAGQFDGVIDFDRATRNPADPQSLLPAYDSGDHLHPNDAGYQAMANAVDLRLFEH
jgi:lysophospholipase L1-like esterase